MNRTNLLAPFLTVLAIVGAGTNAQAQDNVQGAQEPIAQSIDPAKLTYDYLVDGDLPADQPANKRFKTLQAAYAAAPAGTELKPTVIGIKPNVYQIRNEAHTSPSMSITKNHITFLGLTNNRRSVVLADNRGLAQGGSDNGYIFDVNAVGFTCKNLTILNYCNVDYEYPGDPSKNLSKTSNVITQAVALVADGDKHVYENVAILSRLDTMFLRTKRSYFKNVFIEGTDDWMGGGRVSVWDDCTLSFPTGGGVMMSMNVVFFNCTFKAPRGMQFYKASLRGAERPVALIHCVVPVSTPRSRVAWIREEAPPRPSQYSMTYHTQDVNGNPAVIYDGAAGEPSFEYTRELSDREALAFNPWNLLRAAPGEPADDWDPAGARDKHEAAGQGNLVYRVALFDGSPSARQDRVWTRFPNPRKSYSIRTGGPGAVIDAVVTPSYASDPTITWSTHSNLIALSRSTGTSVEITGQNSTDQAQWVPLRATAANGICATAWIYVEPKYSDPPAIVAGPRLSAPTGGTLALEYALKLDGKIDQSIVIWSICDDALGANERQIAVSRANEPLRSLPLTPGHVGKFIKASIAPKHPLSEPGERVSVIAAVPIGASDIAATTVNPNFRHFVEKPHDSFVSGLWTVTGNWTIVPGANFENGFGIHPETTGTLLYQQDVPWGDMRVDMVLSPDKTAGQFFAVPGSPEAGRLNADFFVKYDPRTGNGYSLRFWRTTQSHTKCMFQLYKFENGVASPLNDEQVLSGVLKPDTRLTLKVEGTTFTADASNSDDRDTLALKATIAPNRFGGAGLRLPGGTAAACSHFEITYPGASLSPMNAPQRP